MNEVEVITSRGIYELKTDYHVGDEDRVVWKIIEGEKDRVKLSGDVKVEIGDDIRVRATKGVVARIGQIKLWSVMGFIVPRPLLSLFIARYEDTDIRIYPKTLQVEQRQSDKDETVEISRGTAKTIISKLQTMGALLREGRYKDRTIEIINELDEALEDEG